MYLSGYIQCDYQEGRMILIQKNEIVTRIMTDLSQLNFNRTVLVQTKIDYKGKFMRKWALCSSSTLRDPEQD